MHLIQGDLEPTVELFECAQSLSFHPQGCHMVTIFLETLWHLLLFSSRPTLSLLEDQVGKQIRWCKS